jgi:hypothetical protein
MAVRRRAGMEGVGGGCWVRGDEQEGVDAFVEVRRVGVTGGRCDTSSAVRGGVFGIIRTRRRSHSLGGRRQKREEGCHLAKA